MGGIFFYEDIFLCENIKKIYQKVIIEGTGLRQRRFSIQVIKPAIRASV